MAGEITMETQDRVELPPLSFTIPTDDWVIDYRGTPASASPASFILVVGMNGQQRRSMSRHPGFRLWMDPAEAGPFKAAMHRNFEGSTAVKPDEWCIMQAVPFAMSKSDAAGYVYGTAYQLLDTNAEGRGAYSLKTVFVWKDSELGDLTDPRPHASAAFAWPKGDEFATTPPVSEKMAGFIHGTCWGRFCYLFKTMPPVRTEDEITTGNAAVFWYGTNNPDRYPDTCPHLEAAGTDLGCWYTDWFGVPPHWGLRAIADVKTCATVPSVTRVTGMTLEGRYRVGARLVDTERGRISNAYFMQLDTPLDTEQSLPSPASGDETPVTTVTESAIVYHDTLYLQFQFYDAADQGATNWLNLASTQKGCFMWDRWQPLSTFSNLDLDLPAGSIMYVVDELETTEGFRTWDLDADENTLWGTVPAGRYMYAGAGFVFVDEVAGETRGRSERYRKIKYANGTTSDYRPAQFIPMTDDALALNPQYDSEFDFCMTWDELGQPLAAYPYAGMMILVTTPRLTPSDKNHPKTDNTLYICWSDPRQVAMENFSAACYYPTDYHVSNRQNLDVLRQSEVDLSLLYPPAVAFAEAGGYLYVFGDGPVYKLAPNPNSTVGMAIGSVLQGRRIVSKYAVAGFGGGIVFVTDQGVFTLVPSDQQDAVFEIEELQGLLRKRWNSPELRASISVAFDAPTQTVNILCGRTGELVRLWLSSNKVTFDEATGFTMCREGQIADDGVSNRQRALFYTLHGRCYYPCDLWDDSAGSYTMHGLVERADDIPAAPVRAYINEVISYSVDPTGIDGTPHPALKGLQLYTGPGGTPITLPAIHAREISIEVLDGPMAGRIYQTYPLAPSDFTEATFSQSHVLGYWEPDMKRNNLLGCWVSLSPIPSYAVGARVPGRSPRWLLERIHIQSLFPGVIQPTGDYTERVGTVPMISMGIAETDALPLEVPEQDGPRGHLFTQATRWLDRTKLVAQSGVPVEGTWDALRPYKHSAPMSPPHGISGHTLFPVFYAAGSGWGFDLFWLTISGIIMPSEKAR